MPQALIADHTKVLRFLESHRLIGRGLGYVDVHLLASVMLEGASIWTLDKRLAETAGRLAVAVRTTR